MNSVVASFKAGAVKSLEQTDEMVFTVLDRVAMFSLATYEVLTSDQAVKTYRAVWRLAVIAAMIAWAVVLTIGEAIDRDVQSHLHKVVEVVEEVPTTGSQKSESTVQVEKVVEPIDVPRAVTVRIWESGKVGGMAKATGEEVEMG